MLRHVAAVEVRVLGALMEKEVTTPEYYPLSLNALVAACNQKSSREPVMQLSEREVETALRSLDAMELVRADHGSRVERYENRARTVLHLRRDETALLCLLLLRGAQTPGELRGIERRQRVRMARPAGDQGDADLAGEARPGIGHVHGGRLVARVDELDAAAAADAAVQSDAGGLGEDQATRTRVQALEAAVRALTERVRYLEERLVQQGPAE